jgi:uncharacterized protein YjiS (DUF1127 family)
MLVYERFVLRPAIAGGRHQPSLVCCQIINAGMHAVANRLARWFRVLALANARLARNLAAERRRQRTICALDHLDDRMLADIGMNRGQIEFLARKPKVAIPTPWLKTPPATAAAN